MSIYTAKRPGVWKLKSPRAKGGGNLEHQCGRAGLLVGREPQILKGHCQQYSHCTSFVDLSGIDNIDNMKGYCQYSIIASLLFGLKAGYERGHIVLDNDNARFQDIEIDKNVMVKGKIDCPS